MAYRAAAGERSSVRQRAAKNPQVQHLPSEPPPFTLGSLRKAVPAHCFKRSTLRSTLHLLFDLALCAGILVGFLALRRVTPPALLLPLWVAYAWVMGTVATGVWVVAHECGHGAFSESSLVCDAVGLVFHSALLVPYFSWKFSPSRHHAGTGSLSRDEVFVPDVLTSTSTGGWQDTTVFGRAFSLAVALLFGWPAYLLMNSSSDKYKPGYASHFSPWSPVFLSRKERGLVLLSDAALAVVGYGLHRLAAATSLSFLAGIYVAPYLVVNFWLVTITLAQHTHPALPHFSDAKWEWLHGACSTVDRSYGTLINALHHHIADTHILHHIFSGVPHYHAVEASTALRAAMGSYALVDNRPIYRALWEDWQVCVSVREDKTARGVYWYAVPPPHRTA